MRDRFQAETAPPGLRRALVRAAARDDETAPEFAYAFDELQAALRTAAGGGGGDLRASLSGGRAP